MNVLKAASCVATSDLYDLLQSAHSSLLAVTPSAVTRLISRQSLFLGSSATR